MNHLVVVFKYSAIMATSLIAGYLMVALVVSGAN